MLLTRDRSEHREKGRQKIAGDAIDPRRHRKSADMNTVDRISPWKKSGSVVVTRRDEEGLIERESMPVRVIHKRRIVILKGAIAKFQLIENKLFQRYLFLSLCILYKNNNFLLSRVLY